MEASRDLRRGWRCGRRGGIDGVCAWPSSRAQVALRPPLNPPPAPLPTAPNPKRGADTQGPLGGWQGVGGGVRQARRRAGVKGDQTTGCGRGNCSLDLATARSPTLRRAVRSCAAAFHGRVRKGAGWVSEVRDQRSEIRSARGGAAAQTWRRPALPPLGGQYPGRGGVSRPGSEWSRVGPPRCDHQVGAAARERAGLTLAS